MAETLQTESFDSQLCSGTEQLGSVGDNFADDLVVEGSTWTSNASSAVPLEVATSDANDLSTSQADDLSTSEEKETYKLFVRNLPPGILSSELLKLFQPYGKVIECEVFVKNYAFVHMESKECGLKAIAELDNICVKGVNINVQEARNKTIKVKHPIGSFGHQKVTTFKLFMSNLPPQSNSESITNLVEEFGRVVEVQIVSPISAFVHIENEESGKQAISSLHGKVLDGNENKSLIVTESNEPGGPTVPVMKLLLTNVSEKASASQLRDLFTKYGMVIECKITPSATNEDRKAVVHLEALGDIRSALKEMNGYVLDDLTLKVEPILETESKNLEGSLKFNRESVEQNLSSEYRNLKPGAKVYVNGKGKVMVRGNRGGKGRKPVMPDEMALDPGYGMGSKPPPLIPYKDKFRPRNPGIRPLFGDNQKQWRLIPMPSAYEEPSPQYMYDDNYRKPMHLVPPPSRKGGRGMGRNFQSELVARDNYEFYTDNYDEFYETPFQPVNNEALGNEWDTPWNQSYHSSMDLPMGDQDYSPIIKKAKPRFGQLQPQPRPLMELPFEEGPMAAPQNNFGNPSFGSFRRSAPLNLPLGEKTYFSKYKKDNRIKPKPPSTPNIPSLMGTTPANNRLNQQFNSQQSQQNSESYDSAFSQDSFVLPGFYANDQIQGPNSNYWTPPTGTEDSKTNSSMLKSNFSFSNMGNNYNANKQLQKPAAQSSFFNSQQNAQQQNQSSDYPSLKPGAKVYVNGKGKVMVRGNRGGKRRKPVMAVEMPSRAVAKPQGFMRGPKGKQFTKQKQDQQKMEYSTWLEKKPYLSQAIPGTIKRL